MKDFKKKIELTLIEACNGLECLMAVYLSNKQKRHINAIISDETMPFISGSHSSKILKQMIDQGYLKDIKMFISSALSEINTQNIYSEIVQKVYPKPFDKANADDFLKRIIT